MGLVAIVTNALLDQARCMGGALVSKVLQLISLLVESLLGVLDLGIDGFAVVDVDERTEIGNGNGEQRQSPEWEEPDEPVGSKRSRERLLFPQVRKEEVNLSPIKYHIVETYRNCVDDVFSKQNALKFQKDKVKELLNVLQHCFNGFLGDRVVFAGPEGACEALREDDSARNFSSSSN